MTQQSPQDVTPEEILAFWFPEDMPERTPEGHMEFWQSRMRGGMDAAIIDRYALVTKAAARGALDHWAETPPGRLALLIVTDQFPRSLWRDRPGAFAQDIKSCRSVLEGIANSHFDALDWPWQKNFYLIALCHCEGPDHMDRMNLCVEMADAMIASLDPEMRAIYAEAGNQPRRVREVIRRFGRHPHRNAVLGRISTPEEEAYIAAGDFPHQREIKTPEATA